MNKTHTINFLIIRFENADNVFVLIYYNAFGFKNCIFVLVASEVCLCVIYDKPTEDPGIINSYIRSVYHTSAPHILKYMHFYSWLLLKLWPLSVNVFLNYDSDKIFKMLATGLKKETKMQQPCQAASSLTINAQMACSSKIKFSSLEAALVQDPLYNHLINNKCWFWSFQKLSEWFQCLPLRLNCFKQIRREGVKHLKSMI